MDEPNISNKINKIQKTEIFYGLRIPKTIWEHCMKQTKQKKYTKYKKAKIFYGMKKTDFDGFGSNKQIKVHTMQ